MSQHRIQILPAGLQIVHCGMSPSLHEDGLTGLAPGTFFMPADRADWYRGWATSMISERYPQAFQLHCELIDGVSALDCVGKSMQEFVGQHAGHDLLKASFGKFLTANGFDAAYDINRGGGEVFLLKPSTQVTVVRVVNLEREGLSVKQDRAQYERRG